VLVHLTPIEYGIFAAAAARLVSGDGAPADWPTTDQVDCAGKLDDVLGTMHPRAATEVRQLLRLLENAMTGLLATGHPQTFTGASPGEQDRRIESWRHSRLAVLRSGYEALKRLAHATYYASPAVYAAVGYPGPPVVSLPAGVGDGASAPGGMGAPGLGDLPGAGAGAGAGPRVGAGAGAGGTGSLSPAVPR
jgi:hypothetical protein